MEKRTNDYLCNLQNRTKWYFEKCNVNIGDLVIIKEDNIAVYNWLLGRKMEVFLGKNSKIRVVCVTIQKGIFERLVTKIFFYHPYKTEY